jgi:DNA-binding IclR family transcriptional regulator
VSANHETFVDNPHHSVLERADAILGSFDADHASLSLQGLIARTGLPKTSAYRLIKQMVALRWLERHEGRYSIGARLFEIVASRHAARMRLRRTALVLQQMSAPSRHLRRRVDPPRPPALPKARSAVVER